MAAALAESGERKKADRQDRLAVAAAKHRRPAVVDRVARRLDRRAALCVEQFQRA